jgi:hypothetical protein
VLQNQGFSVVFRAGAVGVDLLHAAAGERGELFHDRPVDKDAEPPATHCAMLQWPAVDHHLARLICRGLDRGGKRHLIARPGYVEVGHILDSERDSNECVRTLQSHPINGIVNGVAEEVGLARRMRRLSPPHCECVRQRQRSAKSTSVAVATLAGHVSTVVGHGSASHDRTPPRSSVGQVRTRCCSRAGCQRPATSTLTYAYRDSTAVLGPLASQAEPHCYDLCQQHAQTLSAPRGWEVIRLAVESQPKPTTDDLLALADAVRDVGLSYDPPAGPTSEPSLRRTGLVELARRGHLTVLADPGAG